MSSIFDYQLEQKRAELEQARFERKQLEKELEERKKYLEQLNQAREQLERELDKERQLRKLNEKRYNEFKNYILNQPIN